MAIIPKTNCGYLIAEDLELLLSSSVSIIVAGRSCNDEKF
jgi:hypothetical protein